MHYCNGVLCGVSHWPYLVDSFKHPGTNAVVHGFPHLIVVWHVSFLLSQIGSEPSLVIRDFGGYCWMCGLFCAEEIG